MENLSAPDFAGWAQAPGVKVLTGDFNGDGSTDIALTGAVGWDMIPVGLKRLPAYVHGGQRERAGLRRLGAGTGRDGPDR